MSPTVLTAWSNQGVALALVAIGQTIVVLTSGIDISIGAWWVALPCAWAMFIPPETASAARALKKATSAVRAIGIGREARVVFMSVCLSVV